MEPLPKDRIDAIPVKPQPEHLVSEAMKKPVVFTAAIDIKPKPPVIGNV